MSSIPSTNVLIWLSVKPLIKLVIPAGLGFWLTRAGVFPVPASRGASVLILNVFLPNLLFSKIVPSITPENAKAIGPIFLVGFVYIIISLVLGVLVRVTFRTPRNFRWGILAAATWSNWGDLPTSVVQTVCASAPFAGVQDSNLAIAYVAIFILIFYITLFPMRGIHLIERDYTHPPPPLADDEQEKGALDKYRRACSKVGGFVRRRGKRSGLGLDGEESIVGEKAATPALDELHKVASTASQRRYPQATFSPLHRQTTSRSIDRSSIREIASAAHAASPADTPGQLASTAPDGPARRRLLQLERERLRTIVGSPAGSVVDDEITEVGTQSATKEVEVADEKAGARLNSVGSLDKSAVTKETAKAEDMKEIADAADDEEAEEATGVRRFLISVKGFALSLLTPPTISLVAALVCALVKPLKALFTTVPDYSWHPTAPDGNPPLAILLDTATFIGNGSVPLGLMVLGSTLGRMRIPRPISRLPLGSIFALALAKVVLLPIIGFVFVRGLATHTGLVNKDNHVLQFVMIYFSVCPTATTQCALTVVRCALSVRRSPRTDDFFSQIFAPEDGESNADILAAYLIAQYLIFAFASVVLTAISLNSIFSS
ncbi:Auxin efflux carrier [Rhodotorula toruloides]|uniref:Auxin efflux carrier n=1 Tax=Rhodotorula toruloides TaxID=5286 RepID=A0A2T0A8A0_RHOTO|nr:Auxin efflux carrier [Rhodotorula toruloides]